MPLAQKLARQAEETPRDHAASPVSGQRGQARSAPSQQPAKDIPGELSEEDATALSLAMQGVTPLDGARPRRVGGAAKSRTRACAPFRDDAEAEARARLAALVARDVPFHVEHEDGFVRALRGDAPPRLLRELSSRRHVSETLDLHGFTQREAEEAVGSFVRRAHGLGLSTLCIVHGKGQHSEGGVGVLQATVLRALTHGPAASQVLACVTAPAPLGGSGALLVELFHGRRR